MVFSTQPAGQSTQIWIAPLNSGSAPRRIASDGATTPHFGPNNEVFFRLTDGKAYYLGAVKRDGTGQRKALPERILEVENISPDRRFIIVGSAILGPAGTDDPSRYVVPLDGGLARQICDSDCSATWSPDGRYFYVEIAQASRENPAGKTVAIRVPPGQTLPPFPPEAVRRPAEWTKVPGVKIVEHDNIAPGLDPSTYAYIKPAVHANLFRIPLR
ncbi:MAG: hypothetical protein JOZ32_19715 [Bryobacterales bacterium]|nr:hypothetical protein [Bryobacterales bacterium]